MTNEIQAAPVEGADAGLMAVLGEAQALDAASAPKEVNPAADLVPAEKQAMAVANLEILEFAWTLGGDFLPEDIADKYDQAKRKAIADAYTDLAIKRGWDVGLWMAEWGAEIALGAALIGPALPVLVMRWKASRKGGAHVSNQ